VRPVRADSAAGAEYKTASLAGLSNFGRIFSAGPARQLQLGVKFFF